MMQNSDNVLAEISRLAEAARRQPGLSPPVADALDTILRLASSGQGDTPEASDLPQTENQSL